MSSTIFVNSRLIGNDENGKRFVVDRKRGESLAGYVQRVRNEKGFSLTDVQRNSRNQIASSYVWKIENKVADADGVTPKKLQALALGLQVSEDEIFAIARGKSLNEEEAIDAEMANYSSRVKKLKPQQRRDFMVYWRMGGDLLDKLEREQGEE